MSNKSTRPRGSELAERMVYVRGDLNRPELYDELRIVLEEADQARGTKGNAIFYLAVADRLFWLCSAAARQGEAHRSSRGRKRETSILASGGDREAVRS